MVLAGGASRRMGRDKALISLDGRTLLARTVEVAAQAGLPAVIVGRSSAALAPTENGKAFPDLEPGKGPLGGLWTGLHHCADRDAVLLLPCDLPWVGAEDLLWLIDQARPYFASEAKALPDAAQAVVPVRNGKIEPLFGLYRTTLLDPVRDRVRRGELSMHRFISSISCAFIPLDPARRSAVADVDTPADLERETRRDCSSTS